MSTNQPKNKFMSRIDFKLIKRFDSDGKIVENLVPDPDRYLYTESNGQKGYCDKFNRIFYIESELIESVAEYTGPIYYSSPKIRDSDQYIHSRIDKIEGYLNGDSNDVTDKKSSSEFLADHKGSRLYFAILSIDIKESTKMSQDLSPDDYSLLIGLFSKEMTLIVNGFNGYILKYTGDGLIAFFPEPNIMGMHDNAIDSACTMQKMIIEGINPILNNNGLSELSFRIGLDSGIGIIVELGVEGIQTQMDILGETVNMANKIQEIAPKNHVLIGDSTARNLHTFWIKHISDFELPENWEYVDKISCNHPYPVYYLNKCYED